MNKKNRIATFSVAGVAALTMAVATPALVGAQEDSSNREEFINSVSEKLGIDSSELQTAFDEVRDEQKAEMQAEIQAKIDAAVESGDLTERQAEIISAMQEIREERQDSEPSEDEDRLTREEMEALSDEEREALMEEKKAEKQQEMIDALVEKGLDVSSDELEELRTAMQDLGIGRPEGRGGHGPRGGMR